MMIGIIIVAVIIILWVIGAYNGLIRFFNEVKNAWAQIDVQLKRRHDLIPNLVETVKGYAGHEKSTLEEVVKARSQAVTASGVQEQAQAESMLSGALGRLMVLVEQYPDLKANQNFLALQEELASTENKIGFARQFYNDQVMKYNTKIQSIPTNIIAGIFNFSAQAFFELENKAEREVPKVQF
ncbi:MAG: LemA family protein [Candidatus Omnitrophota bacterium]|nr:MAG: LemA family protein [Candidatus Omnitrophota bacterium]